jgi:pimeloyl-ACP methyl ester carboxylesterase
MRREEITAFGELAGDAAGGLASQIHQMHSGIAARVWRAVGPAAIPVRLVHDQIADRGYSAAARLTRGVVTASVSALGVAQAEDAESIEGTVTGRAVVGALNGIWGDTLARRDNHLALKTTLRAAGRDVVLTPAGLRRAYPHPTSRLAVFVHGLCETDDAWMLGGARTVPYGYRLQAELGYTPLYVRYNTGLHISENGRQLARLLDRVVQAWPTEAHEIALIGHSMGGLVARSACHYSDGAAWSSKVRHVFTLGSPHLGAPLEQAANAASYALGRIPETRALLAAPLNLRSVGIKDLRFGYLVDECWAGQDADAFLTNTSRDIPFLRTANHYFMCATVSREPDALSGRIVGDLLVLRASAWAQKRGERVRFAVDHYSHLGGANHLELLNHPALYDQIRRWMAPERALPRALAQPAPGVEDPGGHPVG